MFLKEKSKKIHHQLLFDT